MSALSQLLTLLCMCAVQESGEQDGACWLVEAAVHPCPEVKEEEGTRWCVIPDMLEDTELLKDFANFDKPLDATPNDNGRREAI